MKKRLSLLMVLMMVLSLVPMSVFATAGTMPGGLISVDDTETTTKKVTVKLTQAAGTTITSGGMAKLTLNKGEFKDLANSKVQFDFGKDLEPGIPQAGETKLESDVFEEVAYLKTPKEYQDVVLKDDMDILIIFDAYFDEEDAGDITLSVEEMNDSNLDVSKAILVGTVDESNDVSWTIKGRLCSSAQLRRYSISAL